MVCCAGADEVDEVSIDEVSIAIARVWFVMCLCHV